MPRHTYRIEIRDDQGRWVPAPGDATGWTLRAARRAAKALRLTLTHDYPDQPTTLDDLRIVDERTGAILPHGPGRPPTIGARKGQVSLDRASWEKARRLGAGNASLGIRRALAQTPD